jgi:hypothetical protein
MLRRFCWVRSSLSLFLFFTVTRWRGVVCYVFFADIGNTGSPNGQAVGYFLAQHKHRLGNKVVEKVTVFRPDKGQMPYLLFWIGDADVGAADEGRKGREEARL